MKNEIVIEYTPSRLMIMTRIRRGSSQKIHLTSKETQAGLSRKRRAQSHARSLPHSLCWSDKQLERPSWRISTRWSGRRKWWSFWRRWWQRWSSSERRKDGDDETGNNLRRWIVNRRRRRRIYLCVGCGTASGRGGDYGQKSIEYRFGK